MFKMSLENIKSNYGIHEFGRRMFEKYLTIARKNNDLRMVSFLSEIIDVFRKYDQT